MQRRPVLTALSVIPLLACSASEDTTSAERAVQTFHALLDSGNFSQIYEESAEDLKRVSPKKEFLEFLSAVHRKLGATKSSEKQSWNINYHTSGTFITLGYKTTYAEGEASEQFVFRIKDKVAVLAGYRVSSNVLITK